MQLYTQNIMHVHTESALLGVSFLMPSPIPSSPQGYLQEINEKHRFRNGKKNPKSTNILNIGTEKQVDKEKSSFTQYVSAASKTESNGDALLLLALRMGSSTV